MSERPNIATLIAGRTRTGKSTFLNALAKDYPKHKKVIIIDVNASPAYQEHPLLRKYETLNKWINDNKTEQNIIRFYDLDKEKLAEYVLSRFKDGMIIFEDCTKYIMPNVNKSIRSHLVDHRMNRLDLSFTFHSIGIIPPFFWSFASYLTVFKTSEVLDISGNRDKVPNFDAVLKAWNHVSKQPDEHFYLTINTRV